MKNLIVTLLFLTGLSIQAQEPNTRITFDPYVALSVSASSHSAYPSIEGGVCSKNMAVAIDFGRGDFNRALTQSDAISNYFWEAKFSPYYDLGSFRGSVFGGYGGYIGTKHYFYDFGVGVSYTVESISYGVAFNNWDGVNYISPSLTYNFN